ncbi:MAG: trypsin-like peptidase domain-containing protein [Fimbriimonadaceae bacterium]|nr:trypsin-like peptidase domain-containing protein [Fimbriimonadaceae bacterium]
MKAAGRLLLGLLLSSTVAWADALTELQTAIADTAERVKPAVVSIIVEREVTAVAAPTPSPTPAPSPTPPDGEHFGIARGTGMIYRATDQYYYVMTNAHVVREARGNDVKVQIIAEREEREGHVVAYDTRTDTAIVRLERRPEDRLATVKLGSPAGLRVGSFVLAIGSPFGFEWSVSLGIVSGLDREIREPTNGLPANRRPETYRGLIQTDASINPGNSGGPLINLAGEVIGMNFAIYSPGQAGNVGVGFAIPVDRAARAADDIIAYGRVKRGFLGVMVSDLDQVARQQKVSLAELRKLLGVDAGAFVSQVTPGAPAATAGIEAGDVIVALNGNPVSGSGSLVDQTSVVAPATEVEVTIIRGGERKLVKLVVGELPAAPGAEAPAVTPPPRRLPDPLGLKVAPLTAEQAAELGLGEQRGVLVTELNPASPAAALGLVPKALLVRGRRDDQTVVFETVEAYEAFMAAAATANATVQIWFYAPPEQPGGAWGLRSLLIKVPKPAEGND